MSLLDKLRQEMVESQVRFKAAEEFPDLEEIKDRWGILRLATSAVNEKAIDFEVRNECDCCNGVKVYALPYIEFEGVRLYSKNPALLFAKLYRGPRDSLLYLAHDDWDETEEWGEFNGLLLDKVAEWLDLHDADSYNDEDDEDDDYEDLEGMEEDENDT